MKILIVEDEPKTRDGLMKIIYKYTNHKVSKTAKDGLEGIKLYDELQPDLIITDIQMPNMDGLTMLQSLEKGGQTLYALVLTAYSEFEYARTALSLGVLEYILKPIDVEEFIEVLNKVERRILRDKQKVATVEQQIWSLINCKEEKKEEILKKLYHRLKINKNTKIHLFLINPDSLDKETEGEMSQCIYKKLKELDIRDFFIVRLSKELGILVLIFFRHETRHIENTFKVCILPELMKIGKCYCSYLNQTGLHSLEKDILELKSLIFDSFAFDESNLVTKDMVSKIRYSDIEYPVCLENQMRNAILSGNYEKGITIKESFQKKIIESNGRPKYIKEYTARFSSTMHNISKECYEQCQDKFIFYSFINKIIESKSKANLIKNYNDVFHVILEQKKGYKEVENRIILKVIHYIQLNYNKEITLSDAAEIVGVTPEYLSKLFCQEININFVVFLRNYRISAAKRMLLSDDYLVQEVAEKVGFKDPKYFNKVFKSVCGVTPSEYRKVF